MEDNTDQSSAEASKDKKQNRTSAVRIRLTAKEKSSIESKAKNSGLTLSEFMREAALKKEVRIISPEEFTNLIRLGSNFNQSVRIFNSTGAAPDRFMDDALQLIEELKNTYGDQITYKRNTEQL